MTNAAMNDSTNTTPAVMKKQIAVLRIFFENSGSFMGDSTAATKDQSAVRRDSAA
jgi:hypothetical protein